MQKLKVLLVIILSSFLLFGCGSKTPPRPEIDAFQNSCIPKGVNAMRAAVLRDTAISLGAQAGLAWRSQAINTMLEKNSRSMDKGFNFRPLILDCNVLPPVLVEGRDTLHIDGTDAIRLADRVYKI